MLEEAAGSLIFGSLHLLDAIAVTYAVHTAGDNLHVQNCCKYMQQKQHRMATGLSHTMQAHIEAGQGDDEQADQRELRPCEVFPLVGRSSSAACAATAGECSHLSPPWVGCLAVPAHAT